MSGLSQSLKAEWIKLRTVRSTWVLLFVSLGLTVLLGIVVGIARRNEELVFGDAAASLLSGVILSMFVLGVSAVLLVSSEFRTGTIRATLAAQPNRSRLVAAKVLIVASAAMTVAVVMAVLAIGFGRLALSTGTGSVRFLGEDWTAGAGAITFFVLFALWGTGLALIIRHSAGAICALILWPLIGEGILLQLVTSLIKKRWVMRFMPYTAGTHLFTGGGSGSGSNVTDMSKLRGGLYFGAFVVATLAVGLWSFRRRDA